MKLLVTGGCGFVGSNLAAEGIRRNIDVTVFDNLSRIGASTNREWLESIGTFRFVHGDVRNNNDVESVIKNGEFDAVFHLAGQVAMTTSISNPLFDFQINTLGTINILDSIRKYSPETAILYSSSNKVYGDLEQYKYSELEKRYLCDEWPNGFSESVPLDFRSPYGCSKGAADQYLLDYHRVFGIKTVVFRHSSMYGGHQFATYDQGWVGWFCQKAYEKSKSIDDKPFTISGNGKQVRDLLHANDVVRLYYNALEKIDEIAGNAFNIGGGIGRSLSLLELFDKLEKKMKVCLEYTKLPPRISDQKVFVADITKASKLIGWVPEVDTDDGIENMIQWIEETNR